MIHICWHCMLVWNHWSHVIYNEYVLASKLDAWVDAHTRLSMFFIHMWLTHFIRTVPLYTYIYRTHLISTIYSDSQMKCTRHTNCGIHMHFIVLPLVRHSTREQMLLSFVYVVWHKSNTCMQETQLLWECLYYCVDYVSHVRPSWLFKITMAYTYARIYNVNYKSCIVCTNVYTYRQISTFLCY
jgi:hypothetical protein